MTSSAVVARLRAARQFVVSRRGISVFKGALVYTLVIILPLISAFDRLSDVPVTYSSMVVLAIAGFPGKTVGECVEIIMLALLGVAIGAANFALLAKLRGTIAAQIVVFVVMVYVLSLVKAYSIKFFALSLLAILMTFNGIYTSILTGEFSPHYLESYFKSYLWTGAITIGINILVFPHSSERQLRRTLVLSLDHIAIFTHLIAKTYTNAITDEEREVRDKLNQTIRADFGLLNQKVAAATIEVNWSRWSIQDYHALISKTRTMQLNLIAVYSSFAAYAAEKQNPQDGGDAIFVEHFLPSTIGPFNQLRRDMHRTIVEIQKELRCKSSLAQCRSGYEGYFDLERQELFVKREAKETTVASSDVTPSGSRQHGPNAGNLIQERPSVLRAASAQSTDENLRSVSARLEAEAEQQASSSPYPSTPWGATQPATPTSGTTTTIVPTHQTTMPVGALLPFPEESGDGSRGCAQRLKTHFKEFERVQRDLLTGLVISGSLHGGDDELHAKMPRKSIWDTYGPDIPPWPPVVEDRDIESPSSTLRQRNAPPFQESPKSNANRSASRETLSPPLPDTVARASNHSLMRVFSMLFAFDQFTTSLESAHALVTRKDAKGRPRRPRIRFHLFERLSYLRRADLAPDTFVPTCTPSSASTESNAGNSVPIDPDGLNCSPNIPDGSAALASELGMKEALALLDGKTYTRQISGFWSKLSKIEAAFRTPSSIFAAKCAGAALVFGSLIWAEGSRAFFIKYNINGSLLTVMVALAPTLGQSLRSFVFQIAGSSLGYIVGLVILEILKNVGGYHFNPYGLACLIGLYSLPMSYLLYEVPQWFTGVLLGMNSCGVLVIQEYVELVIDHNTSFGEPPIRVGRALAGLAIALAIVLAFQLLVLRNPARRTLRKSLARLMYSNMSYNTILQAFVRGTMPADPTLRPPQAAIDRILVELIHREHKIQAEILGILPLVAFAKDEPQFLKPFQVTAVMKIIRANQIILDRMSESRCAIGSVPFSEHLLKNLVYHLSPYRNRGTKSIKNHFCLTSSSLMSKTPLPHDMGLENWVENLTHDALIASRRFASTPEGMQSIHNGEFTRYWFYLLTITSIAEQLQNVEDACRSLFGEIEDDPRLS